MDIVMTKIKIEIKITIQCKTKYSKFFRYDINNNSNRKKTGKEKFNYCYHVIAYENKN